MNTAQPSQDILAPPIKSVTVRLPVEAAFHLFFEEINTWWPLATHSVGGNKVIACHTERRVGGRFYEIQADGTQSDWGQVLAWEPPQRVVFTLHPGRTADFSPQVEVNFKPEGKETLVTLTHSPWERCGAGAAAEHRGYEGGWEHILGKYACQAATH